jgi:hypothetical protein
MKIYQVSRQTLDGLEEKKWFTNKRKAQKQNTNRKGICHFLDLWTNE